MKRHFTFAMFASQWPLAPTLVLVFALFISGLHAAHAQGAGVNADLKITDRLIVKYRDDIATPPLARTDRRIVMAPVNDQRRRTLESRMRESGFAMGDAKSTSFGAHVVHIGRMARGDDVARLADRLKASDPDIEYAVPDRFVYLATMPNDPMFKSQWPLYEQVGGIAAAPAWNLMAQFARAATDPDLPIVAIVDTGYRPHVDQDLPEFGKNYINAEATSPLDTGDMRLAGQCPNVPAPQANSWHGLAVQGVISARAYNGIGIASVASQGVKIYQSRVFGPCGGYLSDYASAIRDAVDYRNRNGQRVRVINLSQGGTGGACELPVQTEISRALSLGVVVVASAGNGRTDVSASSPANCVGAVAVAATDRWGSRAAYSNYGSGITLSAPGGDDYTGATSDGVLTTWFNVQDYETTGTMASDYAYVRGTSFSAPHVSAAAALLFSLNPKLTPAKVIDILTSTARPLPGMCPEGCGAGILDLDRALQSQVPAAAALLHYYKPRTAAHYYTINGSELRGGADGWRFENIAGFLLPRPLANTQPLYRYHHRNGDYLYTARRDELGDGRDGWRYEGVTGYCPTVAGPHTQKLYRYYQRHLGRHFYTVRWNDLRDGKYGWTYEGVACLTFTSPRMP